MFNLEIGRFIAVTNTSVAAEVPAAITCAADIASEVVDAGAAVVTVTDKPVTGRAAPVICRRVRR